MNSTDIVLSIVIVNYNSEDYLMECLQSIEDTRGTLALETIVVDNASQDDSVEKVRANFPNVRLIANKDNRGFTRGNNQGIRISKGRYILLLNNDTRVLPGALQTMVETMERHSGIGLLGCRLLNGDGTLQQSFGKKMNFVNDFFRKYVTNQYEKFKNPIVGKYLYWKHSKEREVDWVKGACMFLRRQAIFDAELMDEKIFMFMEEIDLSLRISQLGWKVYYTPHAEVVHYGGVSTQSNSYNAKVEYHKSQLHFYKKHHGPLGLRFLKIYLYVRMSRNILWWSFVEKLSDKYTEISRERKRFCYHVLGEIRRFK